MIVLFTDFGLAGPYMGQMHGAILKEFPSARIVDLFADAPAHDPRRSAYLLAAYVDEFPASTTFVCVVDPGVGGSRRALALEADSRWLVGPDNGLLAMAARRARAAAWWHITWRPERLSASFHGRDLFAPIAARIAAALPGTGIGPDGLVPISANDLVGRDWPDDLGEVIYIDHFGNAMTGLRAGTIPPKANLVLGDGQPVVRSRTFSDVPEGEAFWYENANGLAEIAVNCGRADIALGLSVGSPITVQT
ncbi:MAG: SAM-dependent chlorinase/fluorinase [Acidimicrobiia bacterium]|nr:SAM-dependent chlorinase/fluorinase [Acidimicrobiia bacterium]